MLFLRSLHQPSPRSRWHLPCPPTAFFSPGLCRLVMQASPYSHRGSSTNLSPASSAQYLGPPEIHRPTHPCGARWSDPLTEETLSHTQSRLTVGISPRGPREWSSTRGGNVGQLQVSGLEAFNDYAEHAALPALHVLSWLCLFSVIWWLTGVTPQKDVHRWPRLGNDRR